MGHFQIRKNHSLPQSKVNLKQKKESQGIPTSCKIITETDDSYLVVTLDEKKFRNMLRMQNSLGVGAGTLLGVAHCEEETLRRDLRLAFEQKAQAERLLDALTRRCDSLRATILDERKEAENRIRFLEDRIQKDQTEKDTLYSKLTDVNHQNDMLQKQILAERNRCEEYKKVAEAAIEEVSAVMHDMTNLRLTRV